MCFLTSCGSSEKGTNPSMGPALGVHLSLITSQSPYVQITPHWGLGSQHARFAALSPECSNYCGKVSHFPTLRNVF